MFFNQPRCLNSLVITFIAQREKPCFTQLYFVRIKLFYLPLRPKLTDPQRSFRRPRPPPIAVHSFTIDFGLILSLSHSHKMIPRAKNQRNMDYRKPRNPVLFNDSTMISSSKLIKTILIYLSLTSFPSNSQVIFSQKTPQKLLLVPNNVTLQQQSSARQQQQLMSSLQNRSTQTGDDLETPADWLMMEGRDLLPEEGKNVATFAESGKKSKGASSGKKSKGSSKSSFNSTSSSKTFFDDDSATDSSDSNEVMDDAEEGASTLAGTQKEPDCASHGRYYCTYKEEYPLKLVTEVTKYYKWPLEKLFRDLHAQIMPKLAQDSTGNLVCDSITRVVRPGWARNTNERWLVVINTENYHQYVTEVVCQYGSNSRCNFIPPCYYSSCQQRYNTQKLLVIDPTNPYRGPFLSEFLFPSCCVCYVPSASDSFQDKYRSSPATIYQRTMQQESANNLYPPQFRPAGLLDNEKEASASNSLPTSGSNSVKVDLSGSSGGSPGPNQAPAPGEIRRRGETYPGSRSHVMESEPLSFPRLGLESVNQPASTTGNNAQQ